jgi:hypothetical protein
MDLTERLSFNDGVMLCNYIYQCAIEKTLHGVIEQEEIFFRAHDMLKRLEKESDIDRLDELLFRFNINNVYAQI